MPKAEFDAFVKRQRQLADIIEDTTPIDWNRELDNWLTKLAALYTQIEEYLAPYIASGQAQLQYHEILLNEENIGSYTTKRLVLRFGRQEVLFVPVGTLLIGTRGRVDVFGPAGKARLTLVNKKLTDARQLIKVTVSVGGKDVNPPQPVGVPREEIEWVWKIASRPPQTHFTELTQEAFFDMILEVVNA
jgi:hypothetical protein